MAEAPAKPFSISFGSKKLGPQAPRPAFSAPLNTNKKRLHSALADPESDHEDDGHSSGPQAVTGFDQSAGGAISKAAAKQKEALVIKALKNRNWREESRRKKGRNLLPAEVQAAQEREASGGQSEGAGATGAVEKDEVSLEAGLKFVPKSETEDHDMAEATETKELKGEKKQTADEEAMDALLDKDKKSNLVLPTITANGHNDDAGHTADDTYRNEDDRFRADVASRPDTATLEDYAAIPVEEFGSAMLRGMGWKDGEDIAGRSYNKKGSSILAQRMNKERRSALLGIGAKEMAPADIGSEPGAWGKVANGISSAKKKNKKVDMTYMPVMLRNSKTGEMVTEEELERRKADEKKRDKADSRNDLSKSRNDDRGRRDRTDRQHDDEYSSHHRDRSRSTHRRDKYDRDYHKSSSSSIRDRNGDRDDREYSRHSKSSRRDRSRSKVRRERDKRRDYNTREDDDCYRRREERKERKGDKYDDRHRRH